VLMLLLEQFGCCIHPAGLLIDTGILIVENSWLPLIVSNSLKVSFAT
jgi:hypothetical protein